MGRASIVLSMDHQVQSLFWVILRPSGKEALLVVQGPSMIEPHLSCTWAIVERASSELSTFQGHKKQSLFWVVRCMKQMFLMYTPPLLHPTPTNNLVVHQLF